ncbi:unnamed protein product, partial [Scytosiphon promiscuus]
GNLNTNNGVSNDSGLELWRHGGGGLVDYRPLQGAGVCSEEDCGEPATVVGVGASGGLDTPRYCRRHAGVSIARPPPLISP